MHRLDRPSIPHVLRKRFGTGRTPVVRSVSAHFESVPRVRYEGLRESSGLVVLRAQHHAVNHVRYVRSLAPACAHIRHGKHPVEQAHKQWQQEALLGLSARLSSSVVPGIRGTLHRPSDSVPLGFVAVDDQKNRIYVMTSTVALEFGACAGEVRMDVFPRDEPGRAERAVTASQRGDGVLQQFDDDDDRALAGRRERFALSRGHVAPPSDAIGTQDDAKRAGVLASQMCRPL